MSTQALADYINNNSGSCIQLIKNDYYFSDYNRNVYKITNTEKHIFKALWDSKLNVYKAATVIGKDGVYPKVSIAISANTSINISVHILVAMVVHFNAYQNLIASNTGHTIDVCHKNNDKTDNRYDNLEWGTREQNIAHSKMVTALSKVTGKNVLVEMVRDGSKSYYRLINKKIENNDLQNFYNTHPAIMQRVVIEKRALRRRDAKAFISYMGW